MVLHRPVELAPFLRRYPVQMWDYFRLGRDSGLSRPNTADLAGAAWAFLAVQFCYPWYCSWPSFFCSGLRLWLGPTSDLESGLVTWLWLAGPELISSRTPETTRMVLPLQ